ncbi:hypothetical protein IHE45_13G062400 [Dioscorea alata]|uniref:Uncharacterized protein n=1 Tax=Dioscorea alata TaxID=55571 RepID=A0ACB7UY99_DIOAL|nr:hypothetical protein IHE45_13G062400 [Dioscorea alata]
MRNYSNTSLDMVLVAGALFLNKQDCKDVGRVAD